MSNPNEARDDHGRWTAGGGGAAAHQAASQVLSKLPQHTQPANKPAAESAQATPTAKSRKSRRRRILEFAARHHLGAKAGVALAYYLLLRRGRGKTGIPRTGPEILPIGVFRPGQRTVPRWTVARDVTHERHPRLRVQRRVTAAASPAIETDDLLLLAAWRDEYGNWQYGDRPQQDEDYRVSRGEHGVSHKTMPLWSEEQERRKAAITPSSPSSPASTSGNARKKRPAPLGPHVAALAAATRSAARGGVRSSPQTTAHVAAAADQLAREVERAKRQHARGTLARRTLYTAGQVLHSTAFHAAVGTVATLGAGAALAVASRRRSGPVGLGLRLGHHLVMKPKVAQRYARAVLVTHGNRIADALATPQARGRKGGAQFTPDELAKTAALQKAHRIIESRWARVKAARQAARKTPRGGGNRQEPRDDHGRWTNAAGWQGIEAYQADQPRDPHGRWAGGGSTHPHHTAAHLDAIAYHLDQLHAVGVHPSPEVTSTLYHVAQSVAADHAQHPDLHHMPVPHPTRPQTMLGQARHVIGRAAHHLWRAAKATGKGIQQAFNSDVVAHTLGLVSPLSQFFAQAETVRLGGELQITAAAGEGLAAPFRMLAYSGGELRLPNFDLPVVVDLAGVTATASLPILDGHSKSVDGAIGLVDHLANDGATLQASGRIFAGGTGDDVVAKSRQGFQWQASIGAQPEQMERIAAGQTVQVNGQQFEGPLIVARRCVLREISIVALGADPKSAVHVAAAAGSGAS